MLVSDASAFLLPAIERLQEIVSHVWRDVAVGHLSGSVGNQPQLIQVPDAVRADREVGLESGDVGWRERIFEVVVDALDELDARHVRQLAHAAHLRSSSARTRERARVLHHLLGNSLGAHVRLRDRSITGVQRSTSDSNAARVAPSQLRDELLLFLFSGAARAWG